MSLSKQLVDWALAQRAYGLDAAIERKTRLHCADNIGIAIAARARSPIAGQLRKALDGAEALSPASFAFAASAHSHMLDFDDVHDMARVHPTAVTMPAALAVLPLSSAGGREVLEAVALSNELACRLGMIWLPSGGGPGSDWFLTQLFGYFSAALSASLVLGLDAAQTQSAIGLAYMQAAGGKEAGVGAGGTARAIYPAFAAMGGVQAALLARSGVQGPPTALDGKAGFFHLYFGRQLDSGQTAQLLAPHGWFWQDTCFKLWPCCRHSHPYVVAAQALGAGVDVQNIERVVVRVNPTAAKLCTPIEQRRRPQTLQDAKYSIPFLVALALTRREVSLQSLDESSLTDPQVLAVAQCVAIENTGHDEPGMPHASITLTSRPEGAGRTFELPFAEPQGEDMLHTKFSACMAYAGWTPAQAAGMWACVQALDVSGLEKIRGLMA
ncbi:MAG: MmgE/PrpD family protein [Polaromonas sp.]|uniref:MmgE/PrpD family protein n=1 Tax=Polaromonas sp. TaxID=1869339 RepID=UPI0025F8E256|nr:MmgE/PrpD family protein [Polaromonas sp.]MBI2727728.1 MmgE/PrpD family protein [Polaromonas sp.]